MWSGSSQNLGLQIDNYGSWSSCSPNPSQVYGCKGGHNKPTASLWAHEFWTLTTKSNGRGFSLRFVTRKKEWSHAKMTMSRRRNTSIGIAHWIKRCTWVCLNVVVDFGCIHVLETFNSKLHHCCNLQWFSKRVFELWAWNFNIIEAYSNIMGVLEVLLLDLQSIDPKSCSFLILISRVIVATLVLGSWPK
jgi:hypothetical protein